MSTVGEFIYDNRFLFAVWAYVVIVNTTVLIRIIGGLPNLAARKDYKEKNVLFRINISGILVCQILRSTLVLAILHF